MTIKSILSDEWLRFYLFKTELNLLMRIRIVDSFFEKWVWKRYNMPLRYALNQTHRIHVIDSIS
jgi:hypothetical protein